MSALTFQNVTQPLACIATAAAVFATSPALADVVPPDVNVVPLQITLAGQDAFANTTFVALGCSSKDGRHPVAIFKGEGPAACDALKGPAKVYPLSQTDAAAVEQLVAKDMGWGAENQAARDLLKGVGPCSGTINENVFQPKGNGVASISAQYRVDKSETGCALTKVGATSTSPAGLPSASTASASPPPSATASPSASGSPAGDTKPASTPAPPPGGCARCSSAPLATGGSMAIAFAGALGAFVILRRRDRRS